MRTAQEVAKLACQESLKELRPGLSEQAFAQICEDRMYAAGAEGLWYPMLVNFNTNSIYCTRGGHLPSDQVFLQENDIVLVDYSPLVDGCWGDYAETVVIGTDADMHRLAEAAERIFNLTYAFASTCETLGALFDYSNGLILESGYALLDPNGNIGHSIEDGNRQDKRIFISPDNRNVRLAGRKWAIEPHIGDGKYGAKFENVIVL